MTFSYEARTATGAMKRGTIVAESRGGAIARIRAQGDVPVSVRECAGGHGAGGSGEGGVGRLWGVEPARVGLWAAVAVAAVVALWVALSRGGAGKEGVRRDGGDGRVASGEYALAMTEGVTDFVEEVAEEAMSGDVAAEEEDVVRTARAVERPAEGVTRRTLGSRAVEETPDTLARRQMYVTQTEQFIRMLGYAGDDIPPVPFPSDEELNRDFAKALAHIVEVSEEDSEAIREEKEYLNMVKEYMREMADGGQMSPAEFFHELEALRQREALEWKEAHRVLRDVAEESPEEVDSAREELNRLLESKGIKPLPERRRPPAPQGEK